MKLQISLKLAFNFLGLGKKKSVSNARKSLYGAIAGIGISLVPLIIVLVVANGMIEGISARIIELSSSHLRVVMYPDPSETADELQKTTRDISENDISGTITGAWPERQGIGLVIGKNGRSGGTIRAVETDFISGNPKVSGLLLTVAGTPVFENPNDAFLGEKIASDLGIEVGDTFRIVTMRNGSNGTVVPRFTTFRLKAIVSSGYQELDSLWVFIPFETGYRILPADNSSTFINISTNNAFADLNPLRNSLVLSVPKAQVVYTWRELNRSQFHSFSTTKTLLLFIMFLIVFVASVNISAALIMLVMERRKEIAILKSMGASPGSITFAFLLAGFFTGLGGLLAGIPVGVFCAIHINGIFQIIEKIINFISNFINILLTPANQGVMLKNMEIHLLDPAFYLEEIPVTLQLNELFLISAGTLLLSVFVSIIPAYRAGQEKPLETFRKF
ncbi:ABC transporter permease [Brucepastera parasyntrophica]|uniref:ABC transporter permease n=1 Tax=Brucepastera parasyntrophica TaxID=2880008 RepID=UPI002109A0D3|nr:ABC transporter permease [Brucepastera parasyntrophica]ULQ59937.1 ABC transporter permease [Brucepastera parasyntrophica]